MIMDYNDKLKLAKEALDSGSYDKETVEYIFPELKESDDERIRKALLEMVHDTTGDSLWVDYNVHKEDAIAWLEKQGEQKLADTDNKFIRMRETKPKDISEFLDRLTTVEQEFLWEHIAKIKKLDKEEQSHADKVEPKFKVGDTIRLKNGDGLEWTVEEVLNNGYYTIVCADRDDFIQLDDNWELVEQKSAWSEEDEKKNEDEAIRSNSIPELPSSAFRLGFKLGWFKALKERVQLNQEWKQENVDDLTDFENAMMHIGGSFFGQHAGLNPNDTNAIKEQANILLGLVTSKEWNEENKI